jgi:hypothetical protein
MAIFWTPSRVAYPNSLAKFENAMEFREVLVRYDGLWTSLKVNIMVKNAMLSDNPMPDKARIFVACCTVIDVAIFALEVSVKVDWRAPEFGLLARHFDLFIVQCIQGTFIGRVTGFRVGSIL